MVFIANAVYKNNILRFGGCTVVDAVSSRKWIFYYQIIQYDYQLILNFSSIFIYFQNYYYYYSLSVPVPDLHVIATWVHCSVPANLYVLLDDSFLFNLGRSAGHSVWSCDTILPKDIHKFLTDLTESKLPMSIQPLRPNFPVMLLPQSWKIKLKFFIRKLQFLKFFFHICNDSYSLRFSCFAYFKFYNLSSARKTVGFFSCVSVQLYLAVILSCLFVHTRSKWSIA